MTTGHVFIATSLDGFIARPDGDIGWLHALEAAGEDHGYDAMMASVDGLIMGRKTFETALAFESWPYEKPVVVMSRSMDADRVPAALFGRVRVTRAAPRDLMAELDRAGWRRAYVDGGAVIRSFLREGLIETLQIARIPRLIGEGLPLFGALERDIALEHVATTSFPSGLVSSLYRVKA